MKIYVDSADIEEIARAKEYGLCDGVTTNPSLIKKAVEKMKAGGKTIDMEGYIRMICETAGKGNPVSLEVMSLKAEDMAREAESLYKKFNHVASNVVIKIPVSTSGKEGEPYYEGLKAISMLSRKHIPTNATLVMTPEQALLAGKAGADYVSPFAGRIDDYIRKRMGITPSGKGDYFPAEGLMSDGKVASDNGIASGVDLVCRTKRIFENYGIKTKIIAASLRNARQVREIAEIGIEIATIPFEVIDHMVKHPKTSEGVVKFSEDIVQEYRKLFE